MPLILAFTSHSFIRDIQYWPSRVVIFSTLRRRAKILQGAKRLRHNPIFSIREEDLRVFYWMCGKDWKSLRMPWQYHITSDSNKVRCTGYPGPDSSSQSFAPLKNALLEWWCLIGYGEEVECWLSLKVACHQGWLSGCYTRLRSKSSWNRNPQMIPFSMAADQNTAMKNTCSCLTQIKIQIT